MVHSIASGSVNNAGRTEVPAQDNRLLRGKIVRSAPASTSRPVQSSTVQNTSLLSRAGALIPAPTHRRGAAPQSSPRQSTGNTQVSVNNKPTAVALASVKNDSGISPFRHAVINAVKDFEATVVEAKTNFKSSSGSDKKEFQTSISAAKSTLFHAIEGAMVAAQETSNKSGPRTQTNAATSKGKSATQSTKDSSTRAVSTDSGNRTNGPRMQQNSAANSNTGASRAKGPRTQPNGAANSNTGASRAKGPQAQRDSDASSHTGARKANRPRTQQNSEAEPATNKNFASKIKSVITKFFRGLVDTKPDRTPVDVLPSLSQTKPNTTKTHSPKPNTTKPLPNNLPKPNNTKAPLPRLTVSSLREHNYDSTLDRLQELKRNSIHDSVKVNTTVPRRGVAVDSKKPNEIQWSSMIAKHTKASTEGGVRVSGFVDSPKEFNSVAKSGVDESVEKLLIDVHDAAIGISGTTSIHLERFNDLIDKSVNHVYADIDYTSDTSSSDSLTKQQERFVNAIEVSSKEFREGHASKEETDAANEAATNQLLNDI